MSLQFTAFCALIEARIELVSKELSFHAYYFFGLMGKFLFVKDNILYTGYNVNVIRDTI